jgi:hypothetical protein
MHSNYSIHSIHSIHSIYSIQPSKGQSPMGAVAASCTAAPLSSSESLSSDGLEILDCWVLQLVPLGMGSACICLWRTYECKTLNLYCNVSTETSNNHARKLLYHRIICSGIFASRVHRICPMNLKVNGTASRPCMNEQLPCVRKLLTSFLYQA